MRKGQRPHPSLVPAEQFWLAGGEIPDPDGVIPACRGQRPPIGGKRNNRNGGLVPAKNLLQRQLTGGPNANRFVRTGRCQQRPIRRERDVANRPFVAPKVSEGATGQRPDMYHRAVGVEEEQPPAIRR